MHQQLILTQLGLGNLNCSHFTVTHSVSVSQFTVWSMHQIVTPPPPLTALSDLEEGYGGFLM